MIYAAADNFCITHTENICVPVVFYEYSLRVPFQFNVTLFYRNVHKGNINE